MAGVAKWIVYIPSSHFLNYFPTNFPAIFLQMGKQNVLTLLVLFPHLEHILLCYRDNENSVVVIMVTSVSLSLKMVSVAATSKQDSMQISFMSHKKMSERFYLSSPHMLI